MKPTLEQLQEFTGAELSKEVLIKLNPENKIDVGIGYHCGVLRIGADHNEWVEFNINNWSDMGALANKHKISAIYSSTTKEWTAFYSDDDSDLTIDIHDKNELRAKAIVFLLMDI